MCLRTNVPFQYTISGDREQVFLLYYKDFFEQICSDVQFISPPEEVGEFLLHLLKKYIHAICVDGHVGISNVHRRLSLIYGENYKIHVVSAPGEGTSIKIWIPVEY